MKLAPALIVHGLEHTRVALAVGHRVCLLSAPGAGVFAGVGWWQALMAAAAHNAGGAAFDHILDCGQAPGRALEALRAGQRLIVLRAPAPLFDNFAERAAGLGAHVLPMPPPALNLAAAGSLRQLDEWCRQDR